MNIISSSLTQHVMATWIAFQLLSAFVQSLVPPTETSSAWYKVLYNFLNALIADFKSFIPSTPPVGGSITFPSPSSPTKE